MGLLLLTLWLRSAFAGVPVELPPGEPASAWAEAARLAGASIGTATDLAAVGGAYYAAGEDVTYWTSDLGNGLWRSDDDGASWSREETGLPSRPAVVALASAGSTLFALVTAPSQGIWRLDPATRVWSQVAEAPAGATLRAPMVVTDEAFYVGSATSGMLRLVPE